MTVRPNQEYNTDPEQFIVFNELLTKNAPKGYIPYYFPIEKNGKEPLVGVSWKKNQKTFSQALALMHKGFNIGIAGTDDDYLCIMDVDDMSQVPLDQIKPTLQITSRKRIGRHYYYFSLDRSAKKNIPTRDAGELRTTWQYVLAPGSYVPCGEKELRNMPEAEKVNAGRYTITGPVPAVDVTFDELPIVYRARYHQTLKAEAEAKRREEERKKRVVPTISNKNKSALWDLTITEVSGLSETGYRKIPMPTEIHGSETGHNCSVSKGLLHCWRHEVTHCPLSYLGVLAGIGTCEQLGKPHGGGSFGIDFQDGQTVYQLWKYAKKRGLIPESDPIPHSALVYYSINRKLCEKKELKQGRIPDFTYAIAPVVAKKEGMNFGRQ
ncbi:MAG: bifunctional DNA primase/polymerase [Candidatus Pacebacteria bacterium]|nr:bifunctional DNA primase/polymerase [Candidatus Paceibacterota bacterium]